MSHDYFASFNIEANGRYLHKLKTIDMKECPYRLPADAWINAHPHTPLKFRS